MGHFKVMSFSWLGMTWSACLTTGFMSLAVLPAQQDPGKDAPRESSFPGIQSKSVATPEQEGKSPASKVALKAEAEKSLEAILYETNAEVGLRNIPNKDLPPVIKEPLAKGTLLWLLAKEDGTKFTRVSVLGGFTGYVFAKYCRPDGEGMVEVIGDRLAFRARPSTKGWPIDKLRRGTRLPLLSKEGEWYKVLSNPEVGALIPDSKIQKVTAITIKPGGELASFDKGSDLLKRAETQFKARQETWAVVREKRIAESKRRESIAVIQQEIRDLRAKISAERERDSRASMDLAAIPPLLASIQMHVKAVDPADAGLSGNLTAIEADYEQLCLLAKARRLIEEVPPKPKPVVAKNASAKRGFAQSGWVRYRPGSYSSFQLVKGGEVLCYLVCDSRRYSLKDYVGCELGLKGKVGPREGADFKVMDVTRIQVLSSR